MKRIIIISCCVMITLFCSQTVSAEERYGSLRLGVAIPGNSDIIDGSDPATRVVAKFKKGMFVSTALGWEFNYFRLEGEFLYQSNDFESASIAGIETTISGDISSLALLFNGYFDYKNSTDFTPYLYAGLGASMMSLSALGLPDVGLGPVSDEHVVAAYQLGGGLTYKMDENISLNLNYRYFVPSDPDFNNIETEFASHNISLGLRISL